MMRLILTLAIAMSVSYYSYSAILTWSGSTNSDFALSSNWIGNIAPGASDAVFIPSGSNIVISSPVQIARIIFDEAGSASSFMVTNIGDLKVIGSSPVFWGQNCNITNNGNITLRSPDGYFGAMMLTSGADFQNNGSLNIDKTDSSFGGAIFMYDGSNFDNNNGATLKIDSSNIGVYLWDDGAAASFSNNAGGSVTMTGIKFAGFLGQNASGPGIPGQSIENFGVINIQTNYPYASLPIKGYGVYFLSSNFCFTNQVGATFNVSQNVPGPVQNNFGSSSCIIFNGPMLLSAAEGNNNFTADNNGAIKVKHTSSITGNGKVSALALDIEGSISPGGNSGHIILIDDFSQAKVKSFELDIHGTNGAGLFNGNDYIEFQGVVSKLRGKLNVNLAGNFIPNIGDEFILFKNTNSNGTLDNLLSEINLPGDNNYWVIEEGGNEMKIKLVKQMAPCDKFAQAIPLDVTMISPTEVQLDWDMVPEVDHYEINGRQIAPTKSAIVKISLSSSATSHIIQNVDPHNTYQWMIRPHCDKNELLSGPWSAVKDFTICPPVQNTFTHDITESQAQLNWTPSANNDHGYRIIGSINGSSNLMLIDIPNPKQMDHIVKDLGASVSYHWMILQNCGMNVFSDPASSWINSFQTLSAKRSEPAKIEKTTVFPNPATNMVTIETELSDPLWVSVIDAQGKEIIRSEFTSTLDISELDSGFYILKVTNEISASSKPLIID
ncbi:MAG: T9SS type A sorting domain-containing protein [Chitinophagales bacterium]|nr:T9SS type A sorting domain-containing protein [Chitinophagales bacterium]